MKTEVKKIKSRKIKHRRYMITDEASRRAARAARTRWLNRVMTKIDEIRADTMPFTNGKIGRIWFLQKVRACLEDMV